MGESGADESQSNGLAERSDSVPVVDSGSQVVDLENSPEGKRLIAAIKKTLSGEGIRTAHRETSVGIHHVSSFVAVENQEEKTQALIEADSTKPKDAEGRNNPDLNSISATWLDRKNKKHGTVIFMDRPTGITVNARITDIVDEYFPAWPEHWDASGGHSYPLGSRDVTVEEIGVFASQLESAQLNQGMTDNAMRDKENRGYIEIINLASEEAGPPALGKGSGE